MPSPFAHTRRQLQLRVRDGERQRRVMARPTRSAASTPRHAARHGRVVDPSGRQREPGVRAEVLRRLLAERLARDLEADRQPRAALGSAARTDRALRTACRRGTSTRRTRSARRGAIAFPGVDGYSRNLWDTTYDNWGPRVGAAYQLERQDRAPRRLRHHLSADQHRLLLGSDRLRLRRTSRAACSQMPYGTNPRGVPVSASPIQRRSRRRSAAIPTRRRSTASARRASTAHLKNGQARQWNFFVERSLGNRLDGVDRLQRVVQPQPAQPLVPDPEPAEHRSGAARRLARPVHRQQRHAEPGDAAGAEPVSSRRPVRCAVRRRARRSARSRGRTRSSRIRCSSARTRRQQLRGDRGLSRDAAAREPPVRATASCWTRTTPGRGTSTTRDTGRGQPGLQRRRHRRRTTTSTTSRHNRTLGFSDVPHRFVGDVPLRTAASARASRSARRMRSSARSPAAGRLAAR